MEGEVGAAIALVCSPLLEAMKVIAMEMCQHEKRIRRADFDDSKWPEKMVQKRRLRH